MVYAYLTHDFRKHISRELWYIYFVWSFSVMTFLRPLLKHLMSVRPFVRPSVRFLQSATPLTVTTQLIDVKLYNVLEIRFIKNSFRSTMREDRFSALLLLYVHKDIDISKVVEMYARQYPRRMLLYNPLSEWLVWNDLETIVYM
jgi:hypothetical protein